MYLIIICSSASTAGGVGGGHGTQETSRGHGAEECKGELCFSIVSAADWYLYKGKFIG